MTVPPSHQRNSGLSHPENSTQQPAELVTRAREAEPAFDAILSAVPASPFAGQLNLREVETGGERIGTSLETWTKKDQAIREIGHAAWVAAGSPSSSHLPLPPMRGPAYKKRGRR